MTRIILFVSALDGQKWNWESEIFYINKEKKNYMALCVL